MCVGLKVLTDEQFFMQVECVWSLMHVQGTVLYLEETKPQQNDIHFVSNLNTVKVYLTGIQCRIEHSEKILMPQLTYVYGCSQKTKCSNN